MSKSTLIIQISVRFDMLPRGKTISLDQALTDGSQPALALHRVNEILEDQAKRIAQAVHDEAGQLLAAVLIRIEESERELSPACASCFQEIRQMLMQVEQQLRELSHDLRPSVLDDFGLTAAVELLSGRVAKRSGLAITLDSAITERLPGAVETALYRIVQESLTNVSRHARAKRVHIELRMDAAVHCIIRDDGAGFDLDALTKRGERGLGLLGIRERVELLRGLVSITSLPGAGTEVKVSIPVETRTERAGAAAGD